MTCLLFLFPQATSRVEENYLAVRALHNSSGVCAHHPCLQMGQTMPERQTCNCLTPIHPCPPWCWGHGPAPADWMLFASANLWSWSWTSSCNSGPQSQWVFLFPNNSRLFTLNLLFSEILRQKVVQKLVIMSFK